MAQQPPGQRPQISHVRGRGVPRWPAVVALVLVGIAYALVPDQQRAGPRWLLLVLVAPLIAGLYLTHLRGYHDVAHWLGRVLTAVVTLALAISVIFLLARLPGSKMGGTNLLRYAAALWGMNIGVFALWYWELDGGGPAVRRPGNYYSRDFVFPQFQQEPDSAASYWLPGFLDYLFLAFNTSTAFSPSDTLVLSARAKALMMTQSVISLVVLAVFAARAVSVL